jgi:hypothetical protein
MRSIVAVGEEVVKVFSSSKEHATLVAARDAQKRYGREWSYLAVSLAELNGWYRVRVSRRLGG